MKRTIYKYILDIVDNQRVQMPYNAKILCAQLQREEICIWAEVELEPVVEHYPENLGRDFAIFGTGNPIPENFRGSYVGTVSMTKNGGGIWFGIFMNWYMDTGMCNGIN